jgi:hypothetical protein
MFRQGAKNWMAMKSMKAEYQEVNKWPQPRRSDSQEQRLNDYGLEGLDRCKPEDIHPTSKATKRGTHENPRTFKNQ